MKKSFLLLLLILSSHLYARTSINVGAYDYPPFVQWQNGKPVGLINDFVKILNTNQTKYTFKIVETTSNRRFYDLENKYFDIIFFENILWNWNKDKVQSSYVFLSGGEVFITKNKPGRDQTYFNDLQNKTIRGFLGYHYAFLNYSTDPQFTKKWKLEFTNSHDGNIQAVVDERAELAIITKEYLNFFFKKMPHLEKEILISRKFDQVYNHSAIVRRNGRIQINEVNDLLNKIKNDPEFKNIFLTL